MPPSSSGAGPLGSCGRCWALLLDLAARRLLMSRDDADVLDEQLLELLAADKEELAGRPRGPRPERPSSEELLEHWWLTRSCLDRLERRWPSSPSTDTPLPGRQT